ncbi:MAG: two-component system, NarL family, response regulator LiaR [Clostridia bacterium]|nr:two-component system, NarL family, response regulator LiaR [Clostridia bacterium]
MVSKHRLLLVDDHTLIRKGLRLLMAGWEGFEVVGEAGDGQEAIELALELQPDIVLMDIYMPRLDGLEATRRLKALLPEIKVVILTVADDDEAFRAALEVGAEGYLLKTVEPQHLYYLLQEVARGEVPLASALTKKILPQLKAQEKGDLLSPREKEVLTLVARGLSNREIAGRLFISENTVKNHLRSILEKLQTKNRQQAVHYALQHGLVKLRE